MAGVNDRLRLYFGWVKVYLRFAFWGILLLVISGSILFGITGITGPSHESNAFGWLFGTWLLGYIAVMWLWAGSLKERFRRSQQQIT